MKLYLLKPLGNTQLAGATLGFVVAAPSAPVARRIAAEDAMSEGRRTWFIPEETSCEIIGEAKTDQKVGIILQSCSSDY